MSVPDIPNNDDLIEELLDRWEDERRQGVDVDLGVLCEAHPDLLPELRRRVAELDEVGSILEREAPDKLLETSNPFEMISHDEVALTLRLSELSLFDLGGMGVVGRAKDSELRREVAVKFMKPANNSPVNQERFLNEVKVTGRMAHPGILPVYGFGKTSDDIPFYAMRYVSGPSLEEAINDYHRERKNQTRREQTAVLRKLLSHFVSVAYTMAYAHERGVIHCDLKPQNILLGTFGETYVIDWGLAVGVSPSKGNFTGVAERRDAHGAGTEGYSHPDQLKGNSPPHREWDIYGLGAVLHKLLTNRTVRWDESGSGTIRRPRAIDKTIPAPLDTICAQTLGVLPEHRYERASEVADDVQRYLSDEPVAGHNEGFLERIVRWQRSHQGATKLAGILLLLLLLVLGGSSFSMWRFAKETEQKTRESLDTAVKFAAQTVALEMNNRWQALKLAARDPKILSELERLSMTDEGEVSEILQARIKYHRGNFPTTSDSSSWFLCDTVGKQVARSPKSFRSTGKYYAHRDYFHGNGLDYEETQVGSSLPGDPPYIEQSHHSIVYKSTSNQTLKVAYSVPVFTNPGTDEERFVGVIGMSVELGEFRFLSGGALRNHNLILVDLRDDWLGESAEKGLILQHPDMEDLLAVPGQGMDRPRLREDLVLRLIGLSRDDPSFYVEDFVDPVLRPSRGSLAAFAKVWVRGDGKIPTDSRWAVIVQEDRTTD